MGLRTTSNHRRHPRSIIVNADQIRAWRDQIEKSMDMRTRRRLDRRQVLRLAGSLGAAFAAGSILSSTATGTSRTMGSSYLGSLQTAATPIAAATPVVGPRGDGTNLWRVQVGAMNMENLIDIQALLPAEITINAGDTIWFEFQMMPGFHTVTFLSGDKLPAIFMPDPDATPVSGPPKLMVNPAVIFPSGGSSYDGTGFVNSGLDILRDASTPPFTLTFTKPGTYNYQCIPHGVVMQAKVIVQEAGSKLPSDQAAYDQMVKDRVAELIKNGKASVEQYAKAIPTKRADGSTLWELSAGVGGKNQDRVNRFLPDAIEIGVGDTIRWVNRSEGEPHTVTFLGGEKPPEDTLVEAQPAGPPKLIQSNLTLLKQGNDVYSGTGYHNSGFLGKDFTGNRYLRAHLRYCWQVPLLLRVAWRPGWNGNGRYGDSQNHVVMAQSSNARLDRTVRPGVAVHGSRNMIWKEPKD